MRKRSVATCNDCGISPYFVFTLYIAQYQLVFISHVSDSFDGLITMLFVAGNEEEMFSHGAQMRSRLFYKAKVKSLRMTALIVLAFIVCWTPYQVIVFSNLPTILCPLTTDHLRKIRVLYLHFLSHLCQI